MDAKTVDPLQIFFNVARDMLCIANFDGHLVRVNEAWRTTLGYEQTELEGYNFFDIVHADDQKNAELCLSQMQRHSDVPNLVIRCRHKNGHYLWIEWRANPYENMIFAVGRDISSIKRTEVLELSNSLLRDQFSHRTPSDLMTLAIDQAELLTGSTIGFFHLVNDNQNSLTLQAWSTNTQNNMCKAEGQGRHYPVSQAGIWVDCLKARKTVIHNDYINENHRKGLPPGHATITRQMVTPVIYNGTIHAILGVGNKPTPYTPEDESILQGIADIAYDLVAHLRTEESLQRLSAIVESTDDGVIGSDLNGNINYWNPAAENILLHTSADVFGLPLATVLPKGIIASGASPLETQAIRKDGIPIDVALTTSQIRDHSGTLLGHSCIIRDITKRKHQESERTHLLEELARKNHELESFTYTVSHDLKSPLLTIQGFVTEIAENLTEGKISEAQENLVRVHNASSKMSLMLQNLLHLSRLGHVTNPFVPTDLGKVVQEACDNVFALIDQNHVTLKVATGLPTILGDSVRLQELFQNLLENSIKFHASAPIMIEVRCHLEGEFWLIEVLDNGIGIDPAQHEAVFGLFQKLNPRTEGTGIGLSLVARIAELHGGSVQVYSQGKGKGTNLQVRLPKLKSVVL